MAVSASSRLQLGLLCLILLVEFGCAGAAPTPEDLGSRLAQAIIANDASDAAALFASQQDVQQLFGNRDSFTFGGDKNDDYLVSRDEVTLNRQWFTLRAETFKSARFDGGIETKLSHDGTFAHLYIPVVKGGKKVYILADAFHTKQGWVLLKFV